MILFQLGREYKLSVAELLSVYPDMQIEFVSKQVLVASNISIKEVLDLASTLGGTIKIGTLIDSNILDEAEEKTGKFSYAFSVFGGKIELKRLLMNQKRDFKTAGISSRFINKNFENVSSAQIIGEGLVEKGTDFSHVVMNGKNLIFKTVWIQDIENYAKRDFGKSRDMQVGMLPPKLSQMMINFSKRLLSVEKNISIYDPFVGLGTILIESIYMGNTNVYGSDLSDEMVQVSKQNIANLKSQYTFESKIEKLNAKFINEFKDLKNADTIVTEGYLGEVMTQKNISFDRIEKQKQSLEKIYEGFFSSLKKAGYQGTIVLCFPFWEINKKYIYAENLYNILEKYTNVQELISQSKVPEMYSGFLGHSKSGSLLYKRHNQLVGREIFKLTIN